MDPIPVFPAPSGNEKIWALLSHLSWFIGLPFLLPLVVFLAMRGDSAYVTANAREALNFHLTVLLALLCCIPLGFILIGAPLAVLIGLGALVFTIIAALRASRGESYRYPMTIRFVR